MKYTGQLEIHYEMGCGCCPQFHDDRGLHGDKKQYWSWAWTINFNKGTKIDKLILLDKQGDEIYNGTWTYSRIRTGKTLSYFPTPEEMSFEQWVTLINKTNKAIVETDEVVDALKEEK